METIDRSEVGAHVTGKTVQLGVYLPEIRETDGFQVRVRIIHAADQFDPEIPAVSQDLTFQPAHPRGLWTLTLDLTTVDKPEKSHFGDDGQYLYRFQLLHKEGNDAAQIVTPVFLDPFATENGPGLLSVFTVGEAAPFVWLDEQYKTPPLDELIIYELNVAQFYGTFAGVASRLDYLVGLGVNCIELMPITPVKTEFDWGYGPIGYFAPEDYLGGPLGLKQLVAAAHARGIAVILDVVYGHSDNDNFAYSRVYDDAKKKRPLLKNPMMQDPDHDDFGRGFEHTLEFTRDYCLEANKHWLDEYHVDGFRYDNVPGFYDRNPTEKYATLVFNTYVYSRDIERFSADGFSRILQIAEDLIQPRDILRNTFSNSTWQNALLDKANAMARSGVVDEDFAHLLDPAFGNDPYPDTKDGEPAGDGRFPVAPLQYINSHDHSWLITSFGLLEPLAKDRADEIRFGDRSRFFKLQPYAVALLASKGVPMLWEGEEFAENYALAGGGNIRISFLRGMHWEYFYDDSGAPLVRVYRRMGKLRRALPCLRSRDFFFYNKESRPSEGLIVFRRRAIGEEGQPDQIAIVALNFSDVKRSVLIPAPAKGVYREMLDRLNRGSDLEITAANADDALTLEVPSNYGQVFVTPAPAV
jgi:maltooligosyltrehalose trehalohydrolase